MPEMSGGWLLPLWKGKGHPSQMEGYRAILLEPTLSRALSKAWRSKLICGLERVAAPLQCGGRKGVGISPLHLMLRIWQSNAASQKSSLGLIYVDIRSAFYRVAKPLLANFNGTTESLLPWQFGHFLFFTVFFTPVSHCPVKRVEFVVVHSIPASLPGHAAQAALHSSSS